jgi:EAL domain-containing protein (putative c-di-GMP-specific phosphodiesterase class I)
VETEAQLARLRLLDCDYAQGYFVGRPVPAPQIAASLVAREHRPTWRSLEGSSHMAPAGTY